MSGFRRKMYVLMSLGLIVLTSGVCMANIVDEDLYGAKATVETMQDITSENAVFVSVEGSDSSGSGAIEKPYATIGRALEGIKAGQTIYIREGVYKEAITFNTSGKENAYITLRNYEGEEVILDHSGNSNGTMIDLGGQSYIHIEGLELRNNTNKWVYGFYLGNGESNIIIKNNKIHDLYALEPSSPNSGANAIICYGERADKSINNILIEGNEVYDCNTGWSEAISITGNCEYISVFNNSVRNTGNIGIDFCGNFGYCEDPSLDQPRYCVARGNVISKANSAYATSYGLYVDGGRDILFENNIIYDSQGGIEIGAEEPSDYPTQNIIVRNNLVYNNSENGITIGGYYTGGGKAKNVKVYNNTVVNNGKENGELVISVVDGLEVANNIFYSEANKSLINSEFSSRYTSNISFSHNLYYSKTGKDEVTFEVFSKATTGFENWLKNYEKTGLFGKPAFKDIGQNEYELINGSIGIDSGDSSIEAGKVDLANKGRYENTIDCGAYEYEGALEILPDEGDIIIPEQPESKPDGDKDSTDSDREDKNENIDGDNNEEEDSAGNDKDDSLDNGNNENKDDNIDDEKNEDKDEDIDIDGDEETGDIKEIISILNEIDKIQVGNKHFLKVALETTYADKTLSFATSDRTIAKVSENGNIKAMAEGEVTITITSAYGTKYVMPLKVVKDINLPEDEEKEEVEAPNQGENDMEVSESLLPSFYEATWEIVTGAQDLEILGDESIRLKTPKAWQGVSLWGFTGLPQGKELAIGYSELGDENFVQVWADGKCLIDLSSTQSTSGYFTIPNGTKNMDICIVASKENTNISIKGLYIRH